MANNWCLLPEQVEKFKKGLRDGEINPEKLAVMSSYKRHAFFKERFGEENAVNINTLFEKKLLLKNKVQGYKNWIRQAVGVTKQTKMDLISKIERMDNILNPKEEGQFLEDLAKSRLKIDVTQDEAKTISELSRKITELKSKTDPTKSDIALGRAKLDLLDYVNSISGKKAGLIQNLAGLPRTLKTSFDLSAPLNQGWGMMSRKEFYASFAKMFKYALNEKNFVDLQAELITHPLYNNAQRAGLRLTDLSGELSKRELEVASTLIDRIPGARASQRAYTGFLNKLRMDVYTNLLKKAEGAGEDVKLGSQASKDIARMVNNFTGGASTGVFERASQYIPLFSLRKLASTMNILNPINYVSPKVSKTARLEATRNLIGSLAITATVIGLYQLITGKKQELDTRSSDFGKIRNNKTRLDMTGGLGTYIVLISRILSSQTKGSSGIVTDLGSGFGQTSELDLVIRFIRGKLDPLTGTIIDLKLGENVVGEKVTPKSAIANLFSPMFENSLVELLKSDTSGKFFFSIMSLFGGGLSTYSDTTNWNDSTGKVLNQFKEKVGQEKFDKANEEFNKKYDQWFSDISQTDKYKNLSNEEKQKLLNDAKDKIKQKIFKQNDFEYKQEKKPNNDAPKELLKKISSAVNKANDLLAKEVVASEDGSRITNVTVEGNQIVTSITQKDGTIRYQFKSLEDDRTAKENMGKFVADLGKRLGLPELNISEKIGWKPEEHAQKLIQEKKATMAPKPTPTETPKPVETPKPEKGKPSKKYYASSTNAKGEETQVEVPDDIASEIEKQFGADAQTAIDMLHHKFAKQVYGEGRGENPDFKIDNVDDINYDKKTGKPKQIYNPFTDKNEDSMDRGLFRINNETFYTYLNGKKDRKNMYEIGILDTDDLSVIDPQTEWNKMNKLEYNVKMAKLIFDKQGHGAWYGSLAD